MAGGPTTPRPPQRYARGDRRALDAEWLAYLASGGTAGDGSSLAGDLEFIAGIDRFNEGDHAEAHEMFERAWLAAPYPERLLCLALSKLGAAFEQQARGNLRGARKIAGDARRCLAPLPNAYGSIDVQALREGLAAWRATPSGLPLLRHSAVN